MEDLELHECQQKTRLALIERDYTQMAKQISEVHEAIVGNGKPGLKTDMELQKQEVCDLKNWRNRQEDRKENNRNHIIALWIAVAVVIIGQVVVGVM